MTVTLAGGVAHADTPASDGQTTSDTEPAARDTGSSGTPASSNSETPKRPGGLHERLTRPRPSESQERRTERVTQKAAHDATTPSSQDGAPDPTPNAEEAAPDSEGVVQTQKPPQVVKSEPTNAWRARHGDRPLDVTSAVVKPLKPTSRASSTSPADVTTTRSASPLRALAAAPSADPEPLAANLASADPGTPSTAAVTGPADVPQLARQSTGLLSDVGVVVASVVFTIADTVAQAFGPNDFLGVPYALATALANTAAAGSRALIGAPLDASSPGRFRVTYGVLDGLSFFNPQKPPPGANDPSITVTDEHPLPIILLNGTTATQGTNWSVGAPVLANAGYKVYTFNYGNVTDDPNSPIQATGDISQSAKELDAEIDKVLEETGAEKVILIGHSQGGGILPAYYINNVDGGADKVSQVIGIAPSNHGTDFNGLVGLLRLPIAGPLVVAFVNLIGPAFIQQMVGSDFQDVVYGDQDTDPDVLYTNIITMNDEIVTPYTQQALDGPNVTNIVLQDRYPGYPAGHLGVVLSPQVWDVVLEALEANPEANPQLHPQDSAELAA
jgi:triacylglycerol esterase/lipase EstA (alpha/beta hydrolase family)